MRDHFRRRFSHLLIDEAQDTDPIQAEIAMFLSEGTPPREERPTQWEQIVPERGKLFVVGDPKQSIYRFRRADIRQMERLRKRMGGDSVQLVQSFRSQRPIIEWVNHLFGEWMSQDDDQTSYAPIVHRWEASTDHDAGPGVWSIGDARPGNIEPIRREEAGEIARLLTVIAGCEWQVLDREETDIGPASSGTGRPDTPTSASLCLDAPPLELWKSPWKTPTFPTGSRARPSILETQEVRDLLNCLRAIDDPSDQVATVAALRSPAFACTDVELMEFYEAGGRFDYLSSGPDLPDGPVSEALASHQGVSRGAAVELGGVSD